MEPLQQEPEDTALRAKLGKVYMGLRRYETAIDHARDYLSAGGQNEASAYNQMGIAAFHKGDLSQAEFSFKQALKLRSDDEMLKRNLDRVMWARGRKGGEERVPSVAAAGDSVEVALARQLVH